MLTKLPAELLLFLIIYEPEFKFILTTVCNQLRQLYTDFSSVRHVYKNCTLFIVQATQLTEYKRQIPLWIRRNWSEKTYSIANGMAHLLSQQKSHSCHHLTLFIDRYKAKVRFFLL